MSKELYRVKFLNGNAVYEIYAKEVDQGLVYGFLEVSDLVFGSKSKVVVDPAEEKLKNEFQGVTRTYIPIHEVLRVDVVTKVGEAKIVQHNAKEGSNIAHFPTPICPPDPKAT